MEEAGDAVAAVLDVLPLPAVLLVDGIVGGANAPALELLGAPPDRLFEALDSDSRARLDELLAVGADAIAGSIAGPVPGSIAGPVVLRSGPGPLPLRSVQATARRLDAHRVLVMLTDDAEAQRLDGVLTAYVNAVIAFDADGRAVWGTRGMAEAYGPPRPGASFKDAAHPEDHVAIDEQFDRSLAQPGRKVRGSLRAAHRDLPDLWWRLDTVSMNLLDDPAVGAVVTAFGPHTDLAPGDEEVRENMQLTDIVPVGVISASADGTCYYRNRLAMRLAGAPALGSDASAFVEHAREEDHEPLRRAMKDALAGNRSEPTVAAFPSDRGTAWLRVEFNPQFDAHGEAHGWVVTLLDVTAEVEAREELTRAREHLWHLANHDALTGLPNRPALLDRLDAALGAGPSPRVALLYGDLDGFKPINDRHGHDAGDAVLRVVAARLSSEVGERALVGRLGGDEFVVLCEDVADEVAARTLARRLEAAVAEPIALPAADAPVRVGMTIGVVTARPDEAAAALLARADRAMYDAKP